MPDVYACAYLSNVKPTYLNKMFSGKGRRCEKRCAVNGCDYSAFFNQIGKKIPRDVSFHRVPDRYKRPYCHQKWKEILKTEFPVKAYVCSMHFGDTDYHKPPAVLSSCRLRSTLRESAVPRFCLDPRERDSYALNENQVIEVKQEEDQLQYFPQETVYLPSSSTELFEENSESELSEASSEHSSLLFEEELEGAPFQNTTDVSQFVQCELGNEKHRLSNGDGSTDDGQDPDLVPDDPPTSLTGNTATEGLDGIAIIPNFSNSKDQDIQCEAGMEVSRRKRFVDKKRKKRRQRTGRYVCVSGSECPCGLPKPNTEYDTDSLVIDKPPFALFSSYNNSCENSAVGSTEIRRPLRSKAKMMPVSDKKIRPLKTKRPNGTKKTLKKSEPIHLRQTDMVQLRNAVASIIHKRSTPNILRRKQLTK